MRYDKVIVIDLEMTCWDSLESSKNTPEIIEIGLVEVDLSSKSISRHRQFYTIPPTTSISDFCTRLTGITPLKIKKQGFPLEKAFDIIQNKFGSKNKMYIGWGADNEQIISQCSLMGIENPFSNNYLNFSMLYSIMNSTDKKFSLMEALTREGIDFIGNEHSGIDDALNTAELFLKFVNDRNIPIGGK